MAHNSRCYIVVDWGTSCLRAALIVDDQTRDTLESEQGIQHVAAGTHSEVLKRAIAPLQRTGPHPVYAFGMASSRNAWIELPYVPCPADLAQIASSVHTTTFDDGTPVNIVSGLIDHSCRPYPDVMRGEETQLLSVIDRDVEVILPGTHSKWASIKQGVITGFRTQVTGELYRVLRDHSFVASGSDHDDFDEASLIQGVGVAKQAPEALQQHLFGLRAGVIAGSLQVRHTGDYLSGLLIGHEFASAGSIKSPVLIIGNASLTQRYLLAASEWGVDATAGPSDAGIRGTNRLRHYLHTLLSAE